MLAVGGDDLDRGDRVGLQAVLAGQPADAAAERVADDVDLWRGTVAGGEPGLGGLVDQIPPARAGLDPGLAGAHVELDLGHPVETHEDRVGDIAERHRVVARALRGDPQAGVADRFDERDRLGDRAGCDNRRRAEIVGEVEAGASGVEAGVAGDRYGSVELVAKSVVVAVGAS